MSEIERRVSAFEKFSHAVVVRSNTASHDAGQDQHNLRLEQHDHQRSNDHGVSADQSCLRGHAVLCRHE
jgi:hypothetical protein